MTTFAHTRRSMLTLLAVALLWVAGHAFANGAAVELWTTHGSYLPTNHAAVRAQMVAFDQDLALDRSGTVVLSIFGEHRIATMEHSAGSHDGWQWSGSLDGDEAQAVTLVLSEGRLAGRIDTADGVYEVRPHDVGLSQLIEVDVARLPPESEPLLPDLPEPAPALDLPPQTAVSNNNRIDVLITYVPQVALELGGSANVRAAARGVVYGANESARKSGVKARFHLVGVRQSTIAHNTNFGEMLVAVKDHAWTQQLRNHYGADLVSLLVPSGGSSCGIGYVMDNPRPDFEGWAYQVTALGCATGNHTWTHEHGHNMGMHHDVDNASPTNYAWSHGWFVDGVFRTIMAYSASCTGGCPRVGVFSSPLRGHQGYPTGTLAGANNARVANDNLAIIRAFRTGDTLFTDDFEG